MVLRIEIIFIQQPKHNGSNQEITIEIANNITAQQHYKKKANRRTQQNTTIYSIIPNQYQTAWEIDPLMLS